MACNLYTLSGLNTACRENSFGGIKELYVAYADDVKTVVNASSNTIIPMLMGKAYTYKLKKGVGVLTSTFNADSNTFTNEITIEFDKLDSAKRLEFMALMDAQLVMIVKDANNKYWFVGKDDYLSSSAGSAGTGTLFTDRSNYSMTFSCLSKELPYEVLAEDAADFYTDWSKEYLTICLYNNDTGAILNFVSAGAEEYESMNVEYSFDKVTWIPLSFDSETSDDIDTAGFHRHVYLRGVNPNGMFDVTADEPWRIYTENEDVVISVKGNILSLIDYEHMDTIDSLPESAFLSLFHVFPVYDAQNLILPPFVSESCYANMFHGCTNLVNAPELPAIDLAQSCYGYMFMGCSSLKYVKCLAVNNKNTACTNWMKDVSATGTFVKNPLATWAQGDSGIPAGWTTVDA